VWRVRTSERRVIAQEEGRGRGDSGQGAGGSKRGRPWETLASQKNINSEGFFGPMRSDLRMTEEETERTRDASRRGGPVRLKVERRGKRPNQKIVRQFIAETTAPDTKRLMTDGHSAYFGIQDHDTRHESVDHNAKEWVSGDVHTNSIENAWSLFKRSIVGAYHQVSAKHLDAYLDEFEFRFNNRKNPFIFRDTLLKMLEARNVEYKVLTQGAA